MMLCDYLLRLCWTEVQATVEATVLQTSVGRTSVRHAAVALRTELEAI